MMRQIRLQFFVLLLLLTACGAQPLPSLSYSDSILAFGDSLTEGYGASKKTAYPAVLAELTGRKVINAGISGETTAEGLKRFAKVLDQHQPSLIILLEGGNDILQNQNLAYTKNNLANMIEIANEKNIPLILLGVPEKNLFSDAAPIYQELADEYDLVFNKGLMASLLKSPKYKSDTVHLNADGYRKMAEEIYKLLKENGAL